MATVTRQPFAPLNGARLQTLTSLKNQQNALATTPSVKRKAADSLDGDDNENVDPLSYAKRSKGSAKNLTLTESFSKPIFTFAKSASTANLSITSPTKSATPRPRSVLGPKVSVAKINAGVTKSALSTPAGRSPTHKKRSGILSSRRRTGSGFSRVDPPPSFNLHATSAPFSLDAALKGTIPVYNSRDASSTSITARSLSTAQDFSALHENEMKSSWSFEIHEDTPEQEMTNLLQHSTCVLDISSDEESESRRARERAEGKENIAPADDVSQTSRTRAARQVSEDEMAYEKERNPLGEMDVRDYYAEGCDENSIIIIPADDYEENEQPQQQQQVESLQADSNQESLSESTTAVFEDLLQPVEEDQDKSIDELLTKTEEPAPCAAVLEPIQGTGESFEVWESGSAKDEAETGATETLV
ncbi:hypothetical protein M426DRAFT_324468 [Hypoxylon sp. CI-4A]|nr:hypothetical protein M426DRAFT_324468 [Hypoxylon sp. CI-4A]